jgi:hypothetical protein
MYCCKTCEQDLKKYADASADRNRKKNVQESEQMNETYTINYIIHKYGPSPYSDTETEELKTPDEAIEYILYDMVCDNRLTLKQIEEYTLDEVYHCVLRECLSKILEYNGLDLEKSVDECKEFVREYYKCMNLSEEGERKLLNIVQDMSIDRIKNKRTA